MKRNHHSSSSSSDGKGKAREQQDEGMDELLSALGYNVRSSDMADVAKKLEQLEMAMEALKDNAYHLSTDTVHYNPSDLSSWAQSMIGELDVPASGDGGKFPVDQGEESSNVRDFTERCYYAGDELSAIPGDAVCKTRVPSSGSSSSKTSKRFRKDNQSCSSESLIADPKPVVLMDSQEHGVCLVHTLLACAEEVQHGDLKLADALLKHVGLLASAQGGAMRKVATYFAEALARRIYNIYPQDPFDYSYAQIHFYEATPYLKFAHVTANQVILEALAGEAKVHVIDFGMKQGMQWAALMQALALRQEGPPATFRLTGIGEADDDAGWKLADMARTIGVEFEFRGLTMRNLMDLEHSSLGIQPLESVAVNAVFELHRLLAVSGAVESVLSSIRSANPKIVTVVEQEASHNGPVFLDRFTESLHYYSTLFDALEGSGPQGPAVTSDSSQLLMTEMYLGHQICNVVACEGRDRVERHEPLNHWRIRFNSAGFRPVHIGSNAFKRASTLALFSGGEGYGVEENDGCLMLGWQTRPLIATSAWKPL